MIVNINSMIIIIISIIIIVIISIIVMCIIIIIVIMSGCQAPGRRGRPHGGASGHQDSAKGGAVETGCSDVYDVIFTSLLHNTTPIHCTPL